MPPVETDTWIDKSTWGDGPWQTEPDRVEWRHDNFVCLALRHPRFGNWCGYVAVPPRHPWHHRCDDALDEKVRPADVHHGITFTSSCMTDDHPARERVCHVPPAGEPDDVWWLGFDCGHGYDFQPGLAATEAALGYEPIGPDWKSYRDLEYVQANCNRFADAARTATHEKSRQALQAMADQAEELGLPY